jgi:hypothetical protein
MASSSSTMLLLTLVLGIVAMLLNPSAARPISSTNLSFNVTTGALVGSSFCTPLKHGVQFYPGQSMAVVLSPSSSSSNPEGLNNPSTAAQYFNSFSNKSVDSTYSMAGHKNFATVAKAFTVNVPDLYLSPCYSYLGCMSCVACLCHTM